MKIIKRLKKITISFGIIGFISALFLWAQTLGLGMQTDDSKARVNTVNVGGINIFEDIALRYCFISLCFLLFIVFVWMRNKVLLKVIGFIPLVFMLLQCRLLIILKKEVFKSNWSYLSWLETTYYMDFGFLALAVVLLILHLYLIWLDYHSSFPDSAKYIFSNM